MAEQLHENVLFIKDSPKDMDDEDAPDLSSAREIRERYEDAQRNGILPKHY